MQRFMFAILLTLGLATASGCPENDHGHSHGDDHGHSHGEGEGHSHGD
jgi:hypothetical protein